MVEAQPRTAPVQPSGRPGADGAVDVPIMEDLTPAQIVAELDRYIIGQSDAKRSVAVALRNRFRRQLLPEEMRGEVVPKNILMMGPTGVGKTEIARRVAKIVDAPFVKVEATRFTEVGYVGRDVESISGNGRGGAGTGRGTAVPRRVTAAEERRRKPQQERLLALLNEEALA